MDKLYGYLDRREAATRGALKRAGAAIMKTPGRRAAVYITAGTLAGAAVISFYGIALLIGAAAVILGLASKS